MALNTEITIKQELRPCMVRGEKALFHCWEQSNRYGIKELFGIIEREDGTMQKVNPCEIRFVDFKLGAAEHDGEFHGADTYNGTKKQEQAGAGWKAAMLNTFLGGK